MSKKELGIHDEHVINKIYLIRGSKVMLDMDLAELYGIETKQLKRAVKRNIIRFPEDFMFGLTSEEAESLRCQIGTSKIEGRGGARYAPMAFTEQGLAMLSGILNTRRAVLVNIHIIRVFTKMRDLLTMHKDLLLNSNNLKRKLGNTTNRSSRSLTALRELLGSKTEAKPIGFRYNTL
jgi:hypothetical protein